MGSPGRAHVSVRISERYHARPRLYIYICVYIAYTHTRISSAAKARGKAPQQEPKNNEVVLNDEVDESRSRRGAG